MKGDRDKLKDNYMGRHFSFKERADRHFFGPGDAQIAYKELYRLELIPEYDQPFTFLSPTANRATHEYAIWEADKWKREKPLLIIAGDILADHWLEHTDKKTQQTLRQFHSGFAMLGLDADHLPLADASVNMVWDVGGCLWYRAKDKSHEHFLSLIEEYRRVLQAGGSIVFDAYDGLPHFPDGEPYVRSTFGRMERMSDFREIMGTIEKSFIVHTILERKQKMMAWQVKI